MGKMSPKVHVKVLFTLLRLISIRSVQQPSKFFNFSNQIKIIPADNSFPISSVVSFSGFKTCNPNHFLSNDLEKWTLFNKLFDKYSSYAICFSISFSARVKA